ncbi:hypothetical protein KAFR_0A04140 [Kazachstania africana CBS 2517]|uniref:BRO1 domain-containing protein n=1 Tax=Kazachstania africana (strain ATCC 22294 / BCRC 22015 / CBS 2517 / CECT 1963 / NBRC 1671 / NRRL Y-8276) TaxID=1071382 RepID=H2AN99_KAZAF|nr:hypothetical protein KAFR_0A04140 [Kazachstania africana CBS 2517]CCF55849.1 hypothetical protein KAFR_0A04140 [Kazachstania africana CBS 2517]
MSELLGIPFKRTVKLNLKEQLSDLIDSTYYQTSASFMDDLTEIDSQRNIITNPDVSEDSLLSQIKYYYYLLQLEKKFPDNQIAFTWFQTISNKSFESSQNSIIWEKWNVLFNISASYSLLALEQPPNDKFLTLQYQYFQMSASILNYLLVHINDTKSPIIDINTLNSLKYLMLAQGMECFWLRAIKDPKKFNNTIISKLTSQILKYYQLCLNFANKSELLRKDWIDHAESKMTYFHCVTLYRMSLAYQEKKKFGIAIKCLRDCSRQIQYCKLSLKSNFIKEVNNVLKDLSRDNDFIYLQEVPNNSPELPVPVNMIEVLTYELVFQNLQKILSISSLHTLFDALLPLEIMEACNAFNERQEEYIQDNLIKPLKALEKILHDSIPTSSKYYTTELSGTITQIDLDNCKQLLDNLKTNSNNIGSQLNNLESILQEDLETDGKFRSNYGEAASILEQSENVNKPFVSKLNILKGYLEKGISVDSETVGLYDTIDKVLIISPNNLPESNDPLLKQISQTIKRRRKLIVEIENKSMNNRILPKLINEYRNTNTVMGFESVFKNHLKIFGADLKNLQEEKKANIALIQKIEDSVETESSHNIERLDPRQLYLEELNYSIKLFNQVKENIEDGLTFYKDLIASVESFSAEVRNFILERKEERRKLYEKLLND